MLIATAVNAADHQLSTKHTELRALDVTRASPSRKVQWAPSGNFQALHTRAVFRGESRNSTRPCPGVGEVPLEGACGLRRRCRSEKCLQQHEANPEAGERDEGCEQGAERGLAPKRSFRRGVGRFGQVAERHHAPDERGADRSPPTFRWVTVRNEPNRLMSGKSRSTLARHTERPSRLVLLICLAPALRSPAEPKVRRCDLSRRLDSQSRVFHTIAITDSTAS